MTREEFFKAVEKERERQISKWGTETEQMEEYGRTGYPFYKINVLVEEVGEVSRALLEHDHENFKEELIQVAAVCQAWAEIF